jgi:hypothetical protein
MAALEKQLTPVTPNVVLTIALNMTSPPEMAKLHELAKRLRERSEALVDPAPIAPTRDPHINNGPGILGTIGALAFGVGLTNAIFGRHHG